MRKNYNKKSDLEVLYESIISFNSLRSSNHKMTFYRSFYFFHRIQSEILCGICNSRDLHVYSVIIYRSIVQAVHTVQYNPSLCEGEQHR